MCKDICVDDANIVGAGGYGIVLKYGNDAIKLLLDVDAYEGLAREIQIHRDVYRILLESCVRVPRITFFQTRNIVYRDRVYLCGIGMEYLKPPLDFEEQVHCCLGYTGNDIDSSWGQASSSPVSSENPTRGFFASPETLEYIWREERSSMTIELLAYQMGVAVSSLLANGILPNDVEWVWSDGRLCILDFGLCEYKSMNPVAYLESHGLRGLADDIYVPKSGQRGFSDFLRGFFERSEAQCN
jgi:hypothetical protein